MTKTPAAPFFLSGLPRSGSTLLAAILRQNPRLSANMTSPLYGLVNALLSRFTNANEFNIFINDQARPRLLRGLFDAYYADDAPRTIIDTNRHWTSKLPLLLELFPETKLVCCVRPIPDILQSFETLFTARPTEASRLLNFEAEINVYGRVDHMMKGTGILGFPLNALKSAFYGPHSDRLMLVSYDNLVVRPDEVMAAIYGFLGLPPHIHDFERVSFEAPDYDRQMGLPGLHTVRPRLEAAPRLSTLPPDIIARFAGTYFWEAPHPANQSDLRFAAPPARTNSKASCGRGAGPPHP